MNRVRPANRPLLFEQLRDMERAALKVINRGRD